MTTTPMCEVQLFDEITGSFSSHIIPANEFDIFVTKKTQFAYKFVWAKRLASTDPAPLPA